MHKNKKTGRGFEVGAGVCYCQYSGDCACEFANNKKNKIKNVQTPNAVSTTFATSTSTIVNTTISPMVVQPNVSKHVGEQYCLLLYVFTNKKIAYDI